MNWRVAALRIQRRSISAHLHCWHAAQRPSNITSLEICWNNSNRSKGFLCKMHGRRMPERVYILNLRYCNFGSGEKPGYKWGLTSYRIPNNDCIFSTEFAYRVYLLTTHYSLLTTHHSPLTIFTISSFFQSPNTILACRNAKTPRRKYLYLGRWVYKERK